MIKNPVEGLKAYQVRKKVNQKKDEKAEEKSECKGPPYQEKEKIDKKSD